MTLTALLPTLRASIPDPLDVNLWPEWTVPTTTDVIVSGVSLVRLVELCDTPCVHVAAAVIPGTGGRPSATRQATAIVVTVTGLRAAVDGTPEVVIDACLGGVPVVWSELRLIGRVSCAHTRRVVVGPVQTAAHEGEEGADARGGAASVATLPCDLRVGDLLAMPCADAVALRHLAPQTRME